MFDRAGSHFLMSFRQFGEQILWPLHLKNVDSPPTGRDVLSVAG